MHFVSVWPVLLQYMAAAMTRSIAIVRLSHLNRCRCNVKYESYSVVVPSLFYLHGFLRRCTLPDKTVTVGWSCRGAKDGVWPQGGHLEVRHPFHSVSVKVVDSAALRSAANVHGVLNTEY